MAVLFRDDFLGTSLSAAWSVSGSGLSVMSGVVAVGSGTIITTNETFSHGSFFSFSIVQSAQISGLGCTVGFLHVSPNAQIVMTNPNNFQLGTTSWTDPAHVSTSGHTTGNIGISANFADARFGTFGLYTLDCYGGVNVGLAQKVGLVWIPVITETLVLTPSYSYSLLIKSFTGDAIALDWVQVEDTIPFINGSSQAYYTPGISGSSKGSSQTFSPSKTIG